MHFEVGTNVQHLLTNRQFAIPASNVVISVKGNIGLLVVPADKQIGGPEVITTNSATYDVCVKKMLPSTVACQLISPLFCMRIEANIPASCIHASADHSSPSGQVLLILDNLPPATW